MKIDLITATQENFEPFLKQAFQVESEHGNLSLILDNIKTLGTSSIRDNNLEIDNVTYPQRQAFALTFEGPHEPVLSAKIYKVTHSETGTLDLFLSAFQQAHDCMLYESVFN